MDNVLETTGVPLTVFGGAVPELAPEDLPEGASPFNQDVDFNPGSVFTRGGRANQIFYSNLFVEKICGIAASVQDNPAITETPWLNPNNATLNSPPNYASVTLSLGAGSVPGAPYVDQGSILSSTALTNGPSLPIGPVPVNQANECGMLFLNINGLNSTGGYTNLDPANGGMYVAPALTSPPNSINVTPVASGASTFIEMLFGVTTNGSIPTVFNGNFGVGVVHVYPLKNTIFLVHPTTAGKTIFVSMISLSTGNLFPGTMSDNGGGTYVLLGFVDLGAVAGSRHMAVWGCNNSSGATEMYWQSPAGWVQTAATWEYFEMSNITNLPATGGLSQQLQGSNFGFTIPANQVPLGFQIEVTGHQSDQSGSSKIVASIASPTGSTATNSAILPSADGTVFLGTPQTAWGMQLTSAILDSPSFTVQVQAQTTNSNPVQFLVSAIKVKVWLAPPAANFNWFSTYEQTNGQVDTLCLDSNGILYDEQVNYGTGPGVITSIFPNIFANTFAKGVTFADIEYIAFSNLVNGTDIPRQWNGTNFDRISMVGPGDKLTVASAGGSTGGNITIQNITQYPPVQIRRIAFGTVNSPNDSTPGNLLVVMGAGNPPPVNYSSLSPYTPTFGTGTTVQLQNITVPFPRKDSGTLPYNLNGYYTVQQITTGLVGGNESVPIFTLPSPSPPIWAYSADFGRPPTSGWFYQSCLATVNTTAPVPFVGVGSQIQITGTGGSPPSGYDGTWTVLQAPNTSNMTINSAQLTGFSCTFSYSLVSGNNPVPGQWVTITNCLNSGSPTNSNPNVFNGTFQIASIGGGSGGVPGNFTVGINQGDTGFQNQAGLQPQPTALIGGTQFVFDAGQIVVGTHTGGLVIGQGQVAVGQRKVCYCFLTRSGYITQPSPIAPFNVTSGSGAIAVSGLATGPPNVVARIVCFTGAGGGNFFYIPQTVIVSVGGTPQTNTSTIVNDNTSTTATFSFTDAVLLTATAIDIPGNNLFNTIELGSSRGLLTYASRMVAWGEQNKVTNFRNLSFDGGVQPNSSVPLGWQLDATNGTGGSLNQNSPIFGWAYQIQNTSGSTQGSWGMLEQQAYQDEFGVPIIQAATAYSVRITASVNPVPASGNLIVDLFNSQTGVVAGSFSLPLNSMTTTMGLYSGTLLTKILQPVPSTFFMRIWAQNIPNNTTILIDRVEPYPTLVPSFTTALKMSYANNQEAFDLNTGVCGPAQNMQPINGAMELFDLLYALKERSWFSTFDNGVTEPNKWNWKEVSNKVGSIGQNSFDWGEGWALTGDRQGVHFFEGGEPIKVSQEIQPLWDMINWQYGYTMWLRNDPEQKRFMVGVPIPTPNAYMPEFPVNANPTSPNVILMCNYRELNTGAAMAQTSPIRSTYMGRLMSPEPARKWSFWNIVCPYSDYVDRGNNQWPQWYGTGYLDNKIFQLLATQLSDDGSAINNFTITYGFVKPEMQDAKGMGLFRMIFPYFTILATGTGTLNSYVYPESPQNQPYVLQPQPLPSISQGDLEIGVNIKGQRFFVRVGTNAVGSGFRCSKMVVPLIADTWSPVRGYNVITA